jgi:hypothetical protein
MDGQAYVRLIDPVATNSQQTTFVIQPSGQNAFLRPDVKIHFGATATPQGAPDLGCVWRRSLGAYAALDTITITDERGAQLVYLRQAARYAHWKLTARPPSTAWDLDNEISGVARGITQNYCADVANVANAVFGSQERQYKITGTAATTAFATLDLSMIVDFLGRSMIPLQRTGPLTITIAWTQSAATMFSQAANDLLPTAYTNPVIVSPQLSYTIFNSAALANALPAEIAWAYTMPELSAQPFAGANAQETIQLGFSNMRVSALLFSAALDAIDYIHAASLAGVQLNLVYGGRNFWPSNIGAASLIGETTAAAGNMLTLQPGSHHSLITFGAGPPVSINADDTVNHLAGGLSAAAHCMIDLRQQLKSVPGSVNNCAITDNTGINMLLTTSAGAGRIYAFAIRERVAVISKNGITQII